jgi:naphtho-gamma-pyrone polyketide synthase
MNSVLSVFVPKKERMPRFPLHLGSAKANIGHAESASGVSSLIKVLMMMKHNEIPPHCGIKTRINHNYPLDLNDRNVKIALEVTPWTRPDIPNGKRSVFLNNFSAAGGNTAVLLEDPPVRIRNSTKKDSRSTHLVAVTAKSAKSLASNIDALISFLEENPETPLNILSYTTTARRIQHNYRTICSGSDIKTIHHMLQRQANTLPTKPIPNAARVPSVVFVFTGQGSLYSGIGKELYKSVTHFKTDLGRFNRIAQRQGFPSFLHLIDGTEENVSDVEPVIAHLALTCVQMGLSRLWVSWGVSPCSTIGHSLGEYAALHTAGVLTASDVIYLVGTRAQLLSKYCTQGTHAMLAIKASLEETKPHLLESTCEIACLNQPNSHVVSGPQDEIDRLMSTYKSPGKDCVKLDIPFAFHSSQVDSIMDEFEAAASSVRFNTPLVSYMSPLLGCVVSDSETLGSTYLTEAMRSTVNFQAALNAAKSSHVIDERTIWVEMGSHPACSGMIKGTLGSQTVAIASLRKGTDAWKVVAAALETLYTSGIDINWNEYHRDFEDSHQVLNLPRYGWDLKNYWIQYRHNFCLTKGDDPKVQQIEAAPIEQKAASAPTYVSPSVQRVLNEQDAADVSTLLVESDIQDPRLYPILKGHKVNGAALCPSVSGLARSANKC